MTQQAVQIRNVVSRSGFANPLTLGVLVEDTDYLRVYADDLELQVGVDYSVLGIGDANGVSIEIIGAEDANEYVGVETFTALYDPVLQQGSDLSLGGSFGRSFEAALDAQSRQLQAVADKMLRIPPGAPTDMVVPRLPGAVIVWNDDGDGFLALPIAVDGDGSVASLQGEPGEGVPTGGGEGRVLRKASSTDYDTEWHLPGPLTTVDNTVPRYDGTGGVLQTSLVTISDAGAISSVSPQFVIASGGNAIHVLQRSDAHGSGAYVALLPAYGKDSGGNVVTFGRLDFYADDATDGSEDGSVRVVAPVAGTLTEIAKFGAGAVIGAPTGDAKGVGTLNVASRLYTNNNEVPYRLQGTATYDPPNLADGAGATTTVTVTGAALGDIALASFSLTTSGITISAWVSATDTVSVRFQNESGGALDINSGTLKAWVLK